MTRNTLQVADLLDSFELHLRAKNRSPKTVRSYRLAVDQLIVYLQDQGLPTDADKITKQGIEGFLAHFLETRASATVRQRYASLTQFFKWAASEGEISSDPTERIDPPHVVEQPVPVLTVDQLRALIDSCKTNTLEGRRDEAIIRLFADTGMRLGELVGLKVQDIDLALGVAIVMGKGSRLRTVPFGDKTAAAIDRYGRGRQREHGRPKPDDPWWLGSKGALTDSGVAQMLRRRAKDAGIESVHPHMFRHSFAHQWLSAGGNEGDLQRIAGWSSPQMLQRYGRSAADQRAREGYRRNPLWGDL